MKLLIGHNGFSCLAWAAFAMLFAGCAGGVAPAWTDSLTFWREKDPFPVRTRADQLAELREQAEQIGSLSPEQQQQESLKLGQAIRSETDPLIRAEILATLANCPTETAGLIVRAGLNDSVSQVRISACRALGQRGNPDAVTALAEVLSSDTDDDVRLAAAQSLGDINDPRVVPALAVALEDRNPALQYCAVKSLERKTGEDFGNDVEAWRVYVQGGTPVVKSESIATRLWRLF